MIKGKNIICFGSENWNYPGFQQMTMRKLALENRILYINSIGTRKVKIELSQLRFYFKKLRGLFSKSNSNETNCMVLSLKIIPLVYNKYFTKLNKKLAKAQLYSIIARLNFESYILWIGTPSAAFLVDFFNPEFIVYHAVDRYAKFPFVDSDKIRAYEKQIAKKADVIICTADAIKEDMIKYNNSTYTISHAVDFDHFNSALSIDNIPDDIKKIPEPIIGYFGGLSERVNFNLLSKISHRYPNCSIVLIGKRLCNLNNIKKRSNVYILGHRDFQLLPFYLKQFSVCLIPYHVNELMDGVDPIKLREYFCQGKPVVSVNLPEVRKLENLVYVSDTDEDFIANIECALKEDNQELIEKRIQYANICDWQHKIEELSDIIVTNKANANNYCRGIFKSKAFTTNYKLT